MKSNKQLQQPDQVKLGMHDFVWMPATAEQERYCRAAAMLFAFHENNLDPRTSILAAIGSSLMSQL
jgi:hypothetical protein